MTYMLQEMSAMNFNSGLADVTTTQMDEDRCTLKVGNVRVLDLVGKGPDMVVECKGTKRDPVRADPKVVVKIMTTMVERLSAQAG